MVGETEGREPGRLAYEAWAWCIHHDSGGRGFWPAWDGLEPAGKRAWARHEALARRGVTERTEIPDRPMTIWVPFEMPGWLIGEARRSGRSVNEEAVARLRMTAGTRLPPKGSPHG